MHDMRQFVVSEDNQFFFANCSEGYLKPLHALSMFCVAAGVEKVNLMTSTNLRKYIATVSQLVSLNEEELEWLCNHLGHDKNVH